MADDSQCKSLKDRILADSAALIAESKRLSKLTQKTIARSRRLYGEVDPPLEVHVSGENR